MPTDYSKTNLLNLIKDRRNTKTFSKDDVPEKEIEVLLEAAVWAPNHRNNEPWRFVAVRKNSQIRNSIAQGIIDLQEHYSQIKLPELHRRRITEEILNYPWLIFVFSLISDNEEITEENYGAVCCAIQNMQLMATAIGLSVGWSTAAIARIDKVENIFDIGEAVKIVGVLAVGHSELVVEMTRTSHNDKTTWF